MSARGQPFEAEPDRSFAMRGRRGQFRDPDLSAALTDGELCHACQPGQKFVGFFLGRRNRKEINYLWFYNFKGGAQFERRGWGGQDDEFICCVQAETILPFRF